MNDKFYFVGVIITILEGSYDIDGLDSFLRQEIAHHIPVASFSLKRNTNTLKSKLKPSEKVYFNSSEDKPHSLGQVLGFTKENTVIEPGTRFNTILVKNSF